MSEGLVGSGGYVRKKQPHKVAIFHGPKGTILARDLIVACNPVWRAAYKAHGNRDRRTCVFTRRNRYRMIGKNRQIRFLRIDRIEYTGDKSGVKILDRL